MITCNRCGNEKDGEQTGFCPHCLKFGKDEKEMKQLDAEEKDIILHCLEVCYSQNRVTTVTFDSIKQKLKG